MKKMVVVIAVAIMLTGLASAQTSTTDVQQASDAVHVIQSSMTDPDSFVLESAWTTQPVPHQKYAKSPMQEGATDLCFVYRSHNAMGGYGQPHLSVLHRSYNMEITQHRFGLKSLKNGAVEDLGTVVDATTKTGWFAVTAASCKQGNRGVDLTAEVKAALVPPVAPAAPALSPEDAAKEAQLHADCLKFAINNPSVVCK